MNPIYSTTVKEITSRTGSDITTVESDIDLYYHMALSLYQTIEEQNALGKPTTCIMPVGPVFQYRRFITLLDYRPIDLSNLHLFFMDEYLQDGTDLRVDPDDPLSFQGFIRRELIDPMPEQYGLNPEQIHFPDPADPGAYDARIEELGGIDLCHAGVGIVGHLAFNEPISEAKITAEEFLHLPTRVVELTRETITINSNTALRGAFEEIPKRAVTVGMKQIAGARKLQIFFNRPWQASVFRKALLTEPTPEFPVTLVQGHPAIKYYVTPIVAGTPEFALR